MEEKKVSLKLQGEGTFLAELSYGTLLTGLNGFNPMELLLTSLGACTGVDVYVILKKKRQEVEDLKIEVRGKRREEHPRAFEEIELRYLVKGKVSEKAVEQAVRLSTEKYCSVLASLNPSIKLRVSWEVWSG
ncbi:MAG: OsmC family protein [Aquificae bacterium]|nr:OsmC family protein [Aquificota bacterium]